MRSTVTIKTGTSTAGLTLPAKKKHSKNSLKHLPSKFQGIVLNDLQAHLCGSLAD